MLEKLDNEVKSFIFKIIVPAAVAVSVKLAVMSKREKVTFFQVIISFVAGIGSAYLSGPIVQQYSSPSMLPIVIATIAISGEKIVNFLIYRFNVEELLRDIVNKYTKK